jgi:ribosomal protein S18 acetylase RimI-like enzyme
MDVLPSPLDRDLIVRIRSSDVLDLPFLEEMLFEAFFWKEGVARPRLSDFRQRPEFAMLFAGWGRPGDRALIASTEQGAARGAAWFRLWTPELHSYGFVRSEVPELGIGVVAAHRSKGIGRALLRALVAAARTDGYPALSLSVSPENPARRLYETEGFQKAGESGQSWTLVHDLRPDTHL